MKASLLQFFQDGTLNGVKPGDSRQRVESLLGLPDLHLPGYGNSSDVRMAALWYYAGIQLTFVNLENDLLGDVGFKPFYLKPGQYRDLETENTELELWIFADEDEPDIQDLRKALTIEHILFQDTGLESLVFNQAIKNYEMRSYDLAAEESFGTLVLKSGVQVRYAGDGQIIRIQIGGEGWMYPGKEQSIRW